MFENVIFLRHQYPQFGDHSDWYIECRSEVGETYGIGESGGVSVGSQYKTEWWRNQYKTWLTNAELDKPVWFDDTPYFPAGKVSRNWL